MSEANVAYVMLDKLGGIFSLNRNLIRHRPESAAPMPQHAVLLKDLDDPDVQPHHATGADTDTRVNYRVLRENRFAILKRIRNALPPGPGVLVSNDWQDLALCHLHDPGRAVVQIVHDAYNLGLAMRYGRVVDAFVAHSRYFYERLKSEVPDPANRVFHLPYGIPLAESVRHPGPGPLRLIFIGRMAGLKGIFDLPVIDRLLAAAGVPVEWTLVGDGPDKARLQREWEPIAPVRYFTPESNAGVLDLCAQNDVLVFPTRFEGFPVALLEAMSAGLVPVVSDLPSGVPEVVSADTGFRLPVGDTAAFAAAVEEIHRDRDRLETMSAAARETVASRFDIRDRAADYHALFARWEELRRPRPAKYPLPDSGSRLDQPWLPNWAVRATRAMAQTLKKGGDPAPRQLFGDNYAATQARNPQADH